MAASRAQQFATHRGGRLHDHVRVVPGVVADGVALAHDAPQRRGVGDGGPSDHEKGRGGMLGLEHVEDAIGVRRIGTVVEGQGHLALRRAAGHERLPEELVAGCLERFVAEVTSAGEEHGEDQEPHYPCAFRRDCAAATLSRNDCGPKERKSPTTFS